MSQLGPSVGDAVKVSMSWKPWQLRFTVEEATQPSMMLPSIDVPTDNVNFTLEDGTVLTFKFELRFEGLNTRIVAYEENSADSDLSAPSAACKISAVDNEDAFFYVSSNFLTSLFRSTLSNSSFILDNVGRVSKMSYSVNGLSIAIGAVFEPNASVPETRFALIWRGDPLAFDHINLDREDCSSGSPMEKLACLARNAGRGVLSQLITQKYQGKPLQPLVSQRSYNLTIGGRESRVRGLTRKLSLAGNNLEAHGYLVFESGP
jgi:hypothetical protein